jgi:predicted RNA-binding protein with PIN domain
MPYLIDGHNLIPHIPGITLKDLEDELALIQLLGRFARQERTRVEVFFDLAPPSWAGIRSYGAVTAHFIRQGITADQAIISHLGKLGNEAKNWTVVTSDREILAEARSTHSKTVTSSEFVGLLAGLKGPSGTPGNKGEAPEISDQEVDYWLDQFNQDDCSEPGA